MRRALPIGRAVLNSGLFAKQWLAISRRVNVRSFAIIINIQSSIEKWDNSAESLL